MTENTSSARCVLLTGATGRIGTAFRQYVGDRYRLRLGIHHLSKLNDPGGHEVVELEIADLASCQKACAGMDTVLHLAANPSPRADFYTALLDSNIKGAYNIFRAAKDQGCRRVVYASSVQAIEGYPLDVQVHPDSPVWPKNMYGVSKCFGEALARCFAYSEGLSSIVVRIGSFESERQKGNVSAHVLSKFVSKRDMCHLLVQCIETPDIQFAIVHAVSDNRFKRMDITTTRQLLGYDPQDDAFALFGVNLPGEKTWYMRRRNYVLSGS